MLGAAQQDAAVRRLLCQRGWRHEAAGVVHAGHRRPQQGAHQPGRCSKTICWLLLSIAIVVVDGLNTWMAHSVTFVIFIVILNAVQWETPHQSWVTLLLKSCSPPAVARRLRRASAGGCTKKVSSATADQALGD